MYVVRQHYDDKAISDAHSWAAAHADFITDAFDTFVDSGRWLSPKDLQRKLHRLGRVFDVFALAETLPVQLGTPWRGPDGDLVLRIRALQYCAKAAPILDDAVRLLRLAYDRYVSEEQDPNPRLNASDLTSPTLQRAAIVLQREQYSMIHGSHDVYVPEWSAQINMGLIHEVQHVKTVADYLRCEAAYYQAKGVPQSILFGGVSPFQSPLPPARHDQAASPVGKRATEAPSTVTKGKGMSQQEIMRVVNRYIGVSGGYLGDFSYRTHAEFYSEYCDLDIDPNEYEGTTRERFIAILSGVSPQHQAKVLRGVVERFPLGRGPSSRDDAARSELICIVARLEGGPSVPGVTPQITSDVVARALTDADALISTSGPISAVDRVHTALHGYLISVGETAGISLSPDASMTALFKTLRTQHPKLSDAGPRAQDIEKILNSCANILDALGPVRNRASVAHPNPTLLGEEEAHLVINVGRALLAYLDAKLT